MFRAVIVLLTLAVQPAGQASSSLVLGRVVDAADGRPIAGAIVTLFGSAAVPASGGSPRVMTNERGEFVARGLRAGTLFLTVTKGGYVDALNAQRRPGGSAQPIQVADGKRITDVEVRMWKHAVIGGSVSDEAGEPVVGARVQAFRRAIIAGRLRFVPSVIGTTDDRGVYRLAGLTPGDFQVAAISTQVSVPSGAMDALLQGTGTASTRSDVSREAGAIGAAAAAAGTQFAMRAGGQTITLAPGTATTMPGDGGSWLVYPTTFFPAAAAPSQAAIVRIKSGEERINVDLQMQPIRAARISGTIVAPVGFAAHVPLRLVPAGENLIPELEVATTLSDASGAFTFPAVPPGQYVLRVIRVPRPPAEVEDATRTNILRMGAVTMKSSTAVTAAPTAPPPIPADATLCADVPIGVGDTDIDGLAVMLRAGTRVSGRVDFDGSGERPEPAALANVRIALDPADGSRLPDGLALATGRIDETGQFTTYGVPPGKYFVRVSGLSDWFFKSAFYQGRDLADDPIELGSADLSGVVLTFTDRPAGVGGTVRSVDAADGSAVVLAFPVESTEWLETGGAPRRMRTARAGRDGTYLFPALPPGEYYVAAVQEDRVDEWQDPAFLEAISKSAQRIRLGEGERRTLDVRTSVVR